VSVDAGDDLSQVVAVYTGSRLSTLAEVASSNNDDSLGSSGDYLYSRAYFPVTAGTRYRIAVDGGTAWGGPVGPFGIGPFHLYVRGYPYSWTEEVVDGAGGPGRISGEVGRYPCAVRQGTSLHAFYYDVQGGNLRHAVYDGTTWTYTVLDGAGGTAGRVYADVGRQCSAVVAGTQLHVFYHATTGGNLRHAWATPGSAWSFETLDGAGGPLGRRDANVGLWSSAALLGGQPNVSYWDATGNDVRRAWRTPTGWRFQTVDGGGNVGGRIDGKAGYNTNAVVFGKKLHLFYFWLGPPSAQAPNGDCRLRHAELSGGTWTFTTMTGSGSEPCYQGQGLATAKVSSTDVSVIYHEMSDQLSCGYETLSEFRWDGVRWTYDVIDCGDSIYNGLYEPTLHSAVILDGILHVFYSGEDYYVCQDQEPCGSAFVIHHAWRSSTGDWSIWAPAPGINQGSPWASVVYGGKIRVLTGRGYDTEVGDGLDLLMSSGTATRGS
jgi:hypothetical protein